MRKRQPCLDRRRLLRNCGAGAAAFAISQFAPGHLTHAAAPSATQPVDAHRKRSIRLTHLTDVHVQPELDAGGGFTSCLQHMQSLSDKPDLILFGGDMVFDTMSRDVARAKLLWDLWQAIVRQENGVPWKSILGNHDVFGWDKKRSQTSGGEALWGKKYALDRLAMARPYYSFDQAGWHFVMLDSVFPHESSYVGRLDDEQFDWLVGDLAAVDPQTPVLVLSHIPILSITSLISLSEKTSDTSGITLPAGHMHMDFGRIRALFAKHRNVKLCLSGHTHLLDDLTYQGVRYLCNGAVSGNWWKGNHLGQCAEGYTTLNLYTDGSADVQYHTYGWVARPPTTEPATTQSLWLPRREIDHSRAIALS